MHEHVFYFDNPSEAGAVMGRGNGFLKSLETIFTVTATARDLWVKLAGEQGSVTRTAEFLELLRHTRAAGLDLRGQSLISAMEAFRDGRGEEISSMVRVRIDVSPTKRAIVPRTPGQKRYVQSILDHDVCFGVGPAGTGKTYLAMAVAVSFLLREKVSRIILTRPAVEAGEALGFLPGDINQKIYPYLRPLYDALHDMMDAETIARHMERGVIEVAPLAYMRGRTLNHAFIILDEAQNTTPEQMFMFLTRLGFDSRCVITGDPSQIDLPGGKPSGLNEALGSLDGVEGIAIHRLTESDVVRHEIVQRIIKAYRESRAERDAVRRARTERSPA